jgi:hypothetical protein
MALGWDSVLKLGASGVCITVALQVIFLLELVMTYFGLVYNLL